MMYLFKMAAIVKGFKRFNPSNHETKASLQIARIQMFVKIGPCVSLLSRYHTNKQKFDFLSLKMRIQLASVILFEQQQVQAVPVARQLCYRQVCTKPTRSDRVYHCWFQKTNSKTCRPCSYPLCLLQGSTFVYLFLPHFLDVTGNKYVENRL